MRRLYPAFRTRWQACRTCVSDVLFRLNLSVVSTASSPMRVMLSPSLAIAAPQEAGSPTGSLDARHTEPTMRYVMAAR